MSSAVDHLLVVANQTLGSRRLADYLLARAARTEISVHLLTPVARPQPIFWMEPWDAWTLPIEAELDSERLLLEEAAERLACMREWLDARGIPQTGELAGPDPMAAIAEAVASRTYSELVVSMLPPGLSRWLHMDLPHRAERRFRLPVVSVVDDLSPRVWPRPLSRV
ncbi:MAG: hypothetical protein ACKVWR_14275 [Acidimicrobiales bacterium]